MAPESESESEGEAFDVQDEDGWKDVEPEVDTQRFQSLFEVKTFDNITDMLQHDLDKHGFNFVEIKRKLSLCP